MSHRLSVVTLTVAGAISGGAVSAILAGGSSSLSREGEGQGKDITSMHIKEDYISIEGQHDSIIEGVGPAEKEPYGLQDHSPSPR